MSVIYIIQNYLQNKYLWFLHELVDGLRNAHKLDEIF